MAWMDKWSLTLLFPYFPPRFGRTMEWDTAAGHAVLQAAGGALCRADNGAPLRYGKPGFENPDFIARGKV